MDAPSLPDTLALRLQALRDALDLTPRMLAQKAALPLQLIQDIEAGLEPFLAPAVRHRLAKVLRVRADVLEAVERRPAEPSLTGGLTEEDTLSLLQTMLDQPNRAYACPACGAALSLRTFERQDIYGQTVHAVRAQCTRCLFKLEHH